MLDDISVEQLAPNITPPKLQRYTVVTSPITPVTPPHDGGVSAEGAPDYWLLIDSGNRARAQGPPLASSTGDALTVQSAEPPGGRDGKICRTEPVCSARKLPVKRKLCLSDDTAQRNGDFSLAEKTPSRDNNIKRRCKENKDPMSVASLQAPTLVQSNNESHNACVAQPGSVPVTQATFTAQPTNSDFVGEVAKRGFQPYTYTPLSLHSAYSASEPAGVQSYSKGGHLENSISNNVSRVIPEMFNTANAASYYDYSRLCNGSFHPYQSGAWNPFSLYNSVLFTSGLTQGVPHTSMYTHHYNAPYQVTSSSGCTMSSQIYGSSLYTQSPVNVELSQFMNAGGSFGGNCQQMHPGSASFSAGTQLGYHHPFYNTYAGAGSADAGKFQSRQWQE